MLTYEGYLTEADQPVSATKTLVVRLFGRNATDGDCELYSESHAAVVADGHFRLLIGQGTSAVLASGAGSFADLFANKNVFSGVGSCAFDPTRADSVRFLRLEFSGPSLALGDVLLTEAPRALHAANADRLDGKSAGDFVAKTLLPSCAAGTFLSWTGSAFACAAPAATDWSTITGKPMVSCMAGETLQWIAVPESFACVSISISESQISGSIPVSRVAFNADVDFGGHRLANVKNVPSAPSDPGAFSHGMSLRWSSTLGAWEWYTPPSVGAGVQSLNGLTGTSQTLDLVTGGQTSPQWESSGSQHKLILPMAEDAGVTAGLISKSQYDSFDGRVQKAGDAMTGALTSTTNTVSAGGAVNLKLSNVHILKSVGTSTITLTNLADGGAYTLIVSDTTSRTYSFSGCTGTYFSPANGATSGRTTYSLLTVKTGASTWDCYVSWLTGFQ